MMYSALLVLALAAQGYARPNCFFACDYPPGQIQAPVQPNYPVPSGNIAMQPSYSVPSGNIMMQPSYPAPSGNLMQIPSNVDLIRPYPAHGQPSRIESFQPSPVSGGQLSFEHQSQSSQKTSISGSFHYPAPSPPISEPIMYQPIQRQPMQYQQPIQKPCRIYSDCS